MIIYKGIELREEDVAKNGTELLIGIDNTNVRVSDEELEEKLEELVEGVSEEAYIEYPTEGYLEVRSESFTFDEAGVTELKRIYQEIVEALTQEEVEVTIGVYYGEFVFGEGENKHNQDDVTWEEFIANIAYK